jgi:hypothetical protein
MATWSTLNATCLEEESLAPQKKSVRKSASEKLAELEKGRKEFEKTFREVKKLSNDLELDLKRLKKKIDCMCFHAFVPIPFTDCPIPFSDCPEKKKK